MDRSVRQFCDVLGFQKVSDDEADADTLETLTGIAGRVRYVYLRGPDSHQIELIQYFGAKDRSKIESRPCDTAAAHIALRVDNVPAAVEAAKKVGMVQYSKIL